MINRLPLNQITPIHRTLSLILTGNYDQKMAIDWEKLIDTAYAEGVAPLLHYRFNNEGWPEQISDILRHKLQNYYYVNAAHNLLIYQSLSSILTLLYTKIDSQLPVVVLKGAALAANLYPDIALRPMSDIDILLPRQHLQLAEQLLKQLGYDRMIPEIVDGISMEVEHAVALYGGPRQSIILELHWSLIAGDTDWRTPPLDWFWEQTEICKNVGQTAEWQYDSHPLQLNPTANLLYLSTHIILQHGEASSLLLWFYDLSMLINRFGDSIDWDELCERASQFRWSNALYVALLGVQARFDTPLPAGVLDRLADNYDYQVDKLIKQRANPTQTRSVRYWNKFITVGWQGRMQLLQSFFFPNPDYIRWRYKPKPKWIWPLCYPYRWLLIIFDSLHTLIKLARQRFQ